jgi:hypothetical protein
MSYYLSLFEFVVKYKTDTQQFSSRDRISGQKPDCVAQIATGYARNSWNKKIKVVPFERTLLANLAKGFFSIRKKVLGLRYANTR